MAGRLAGTRADREREARRLRGQGLTLREIGERMGVAISTVDAYLNDPGGERMRARKASYGGPCPECGGPTNGSDGRMARPVQRCASCRAWSLEAVLAAMRAWAEKYGAPPKVDQWRVAGPENPNQSLVVGRWGWNATLRMAGLPVRCDRDPEIWERTVEMLRAGMTADEIGREFGVTRYAIYERCRKRGVTVTDIRRGVSA